MSGGLNCVPMLLTKLKCLRFLLKWGSIIAYEVLNRQAGIKSWTSKNSDISLMNNS